MSMMAVRWGVLAAACLVSIGVASAQESKSESLASIPAKELESAQESRVQELMQRGVRELSGKDLVELLDRLYAGYRSPNKEAAALQEELTKNRKPLLRAALKVAADARNTNNFEAVANALGALGEKESVDQVELLRPLLGRKRTGMSPLMAPLDDLSVEAIQSYKGMEKAIERCGSVGDTESLKEIEFTLPLVADLPDAMRLRLAKQLEAAKKNIQQPVGEDAEILKTLSKSNRAVTAPGVLIVDPNGRQTAPAPGVNVTLPPGYAAILTKDDAVATPGTLGITLYTGGNGRPIRSGTPNSWLMYSTGKPLTLVVNGQRIQWATTAAAFFSTEARSRTPLQFEQVPGLGEIQARADVIQFPGGPAGFVGTGAGGVKMVFATNSSAAVVRNGSTVRSVTQKYWYSLKRGPDLIQNP